MSRINYLDVYSPEDLEKAVKSAYNERAILRFYRPSCPSCQRITPHWMREIHNPANKNVTFISINVEDNRELGAAFKIQYVPTFMSVERGHSRHTFTGADDHKLDSLIKTGSA